MFFGVMTINVWWIKILTNNHFQMEDDKIYEMGHFGNFHFNSFLVNQFKPKPNVIFFFKALLYYIYHKYTHHSLNLIFFK
jgi:hypothetical protein